MNVELLKAFVAVAESQSISEASIKLCKTQSTITKSVQRLEQLLGGDLLDRKGSGLTLTRRGQLILNSALEIIRNEKALISLSKSIDKDNAKVFNVAFDAIIPFVLVGKFISLKSDFISSMHLRLQSRIFDEAYKLVEKGDADIAITAMLRDSGELHYRHIGDLEVVNVVCSNTAEKYWTTLPQCVLVDRDATNKSSNVISISKQISVQTIEQKYQLIHSGFAWGRVPFILAKNAIENEKLDVRDAPGVHTRQSLPVYCVSANSELLNVDGVN